MAGERNDVLLLETTQGVSELDFGEALFVLVVGYKSLLLLEFLVDIFKEAPVFEALLENSILVFRLKNQKQLTKMLFICSQISRTFSLAVVDTPVVIRSMSISPVMGLVALWRIATRIRR